MLVARYETRNPAKERLSRTIRRIAGSRRTEAEHPNQPKDDGCEARDLVGGIDQGLAAVKDEPLPTGPLLVGGVGVAVAVCIVAEELLFGLVCLAWCEFIGYDKLTLLIRHNGLDANEMANET
jgi:hypothetical protein